MRSLYVAMTRGIHSNDAYLATSGEQTAPDIFTQCLIADWIDQPAHARQAELRGEPPHRAGLLDGAVLRDLLERRHQLTDELQRAETRHQQLPVEIRSAQADKAAAQRARSEMYEQQRSAEALLADYDRPLRRHRHQSEITAARGVLAVLPDPSGQRRP